MSWLLAPFGLPTLDPCVEKNQPGALDSECPPIAIGGFLTLDGCCRPSTNTCGYMANDLANGAVQLGLGCVEPAALGQTPDGGVSGCTPG